jgi:uncharacterized protein involved in exopolysaccharide biosynthesis
MMHRSRTPMTIPQLKRSMNARFKRVEQRFDRIDRRFEAESSRLRQEIREQEETTRRHFDVVVESLRDDLRLFVEAIRSQSERLGDHEVRLRRLGQRRLS